MVTDEFGDDDISDLLGRLRRLRASTDRLSSA
jgi:hypothetical protein